MLNIKKIASHFIYILSMLYSIAFGVLAYLEWSRIRHVTFYLKSQEKPMFDDAFKIDMVVSGSIREELFKNLQFVMPMVLIAIFIYLLYYSPPIYKGLILLASPIIGSAVAMLPFVFTPYAPDKYLPIGTTLYYLYRCVHNTKWVLLAISAIYIVIMLYKYKIGKKIS